jgi:hypothetical protein
MQEKLVALTKTPPMMKTFAKSSSSGLDPAMLHTSLQDNDIMTSKVSVAAKEAQIKDFQRRIHTESMMQNAAEFRLREVARPRRSISRILERHLRGETPLIYMIFDT